MTRLALQEHRQRGDACQKERNQRGVLHMITSMHTQSNTDSCKVNCSLFAIASLSERMGYFFIFSETHKHNKEENETIHLNSSSFQYLQSIWRRLQICACAKFLSKVHLPDIILINLKFKYKTLLKVFLGHQMSFISVPAEFTLYHGRN